MSSLMLINPRKRRKTRSPAQKAATRRMVAARKTRHAPAHSAPAKRRSNPISHAHALHRRAKRRSNPSTRSPGVMGMVAPVLQGAAGAIAVNAICNMLPLPHAMAVGQMRHVTRAGVAIAVGILGKKFLGRAAAKMAEGALIVEATHAISEMIGGTVPALAFHGLGAIPDYSGMGAIIEESQGAIEFQPSGTESMHGLGLGAIPEYV